MWMRNERMRSAMARNRTLRQVFMGASNRLQMFLLGGHKDPETIDRLRRARVGAESLISVDEQFLLHELASAQSRLDGDFAEVGVYEGGSARLLAELKGRAELHLFDTFGGLPVPDDAEGRVFAKGLFNANLERVRRNVGDRPGVHFHPGLFPATAAPVADRCFSLVHLDVDLEASTLAGFEFFYERLVPGGIIVTHDYSIIPGVARACHRFLAGKPETMIELPTTQAMLIKRAA